MLNEVYGFAFRRACGGLSLSQMPQFVYLMCHLLLGPPACQLQPGLEPFGLGPIFSPGRWNAGSFNLFFENLDCF